MTAIRLLVCMCAMGATWRHPEPKEPLRPGKRLDEVCEQRSRNASIDEMLTETLADRSRSSALICMARKQFKRCPYCLPQRISQTSSIRIDDIVAESDMVAARWTQAREHTEGTA